MFGSKIKSEKKKVEVDEKIRSAVLASRSAIAAAEATKADLAGQLDAAEKELKLIEVKLTLAERERDEAMDRFVTHEIGESERDVSVQAVHALRMKRETVESVVSACEKGLREIKTQIDILNIELKNVMQRFWNELFNALLLDMQGDDVRGKFLRTMTAFLNSRSGNMGGFGERFFQVHFDLFYPTPDEQQKINSEFDEEFLS